MTIPVRFWSGVREEDAGSFFITVRRGVSKGERSPTSVGGGPWSFVGSSGASGLESPAPMAPSPPANPARIFLRLFETSVMTQNLSTGAGIGVARLGDNQIVARLLASWFFRLQIDIEKRRLAHAGDVARLGYREIDTIDGAYLAPMRSCLVF